MKGSLIIYKPEGAVANPTVPPFVEADFQNIANVYQSILSSEGFDTDVHAHLMDDGSIGIAFTEDRVPEDQIALFRDRVDLISEVIHETINLSVSEWERRTGYVGPSFKVSVMHECTFTPRPTMGPINLSDFSDHEFGEGIRALLNDECPKCGNVGYKPGECPDCDPEVTDGDGS